MMAGKGSGRIVPREELFRTDDFPDCTESEKQKIFDYQATRADAGLQTCPYSRVPIGKKLMCKIFGKRCYFGSDWVFCTSFQEWFLEDGRVKAEQERLEDLSPVGG